MRQVLKDVVSMAYDCSMTTKQEVARLALVHHAMETQGLVTKVKVPKFKFVGVGCYRTAYLHAETNTVFKVANDGYEGENECQRSEYANSLNVPTSVVYEGVTINFPDMELFEFGRDAVVAMRFVSGEYSECNSYYGSDCSCGLTPCHIDVQDYAERVSGIADLHYENVLWDGKEYWVVDLGNG